jgi:HSP20 family protein
MAITKWEPFDSLMPLREAMNHLFEESFIGPAGFDTLSLSRVMPLDIYETEGAFEIEVALPGVRPDDVEVTTQGRTITIEVTRKPVERAGKAGKYLRREHFTGELTRTIELPLLIQSEHITATFEHGLLLLHVPKTERAQPRKIPLRTAEEKPAGDMLPMAKAKGLLRQRTSQRTTLAPEGPARPLKDVDSIIGRV